MTNIRFVTEAVKKKPREKAEGKNVPKKQQTVKRLWPFPGDDNFVNCAFCGIRIGPNYMERVAYEKPIGVHVRQVYPNNPHVCEDCAKTFR